MVIEEFVEVVKLHYVEVKKNQNERLNGAEFFKICQIMADKLQDSSPRDIPERTARSHADYGKATGGSGAGEVFRESLINELTMEDR